jgi:hypothetical protein
MAITLVSTIGTAAVQASGSTAVVTVPAAGAAAGNFVILATGTADAGVTVTIADSRSNTYQIDVTKNDVGGGKSVSIGSSRITTALQSGDTITATFSIGTCTQRRLASYEVSGLNPVSWFDVGVGAVAATASPNSGTATTTVATSLLFGACDFNNGGGVYAPGSTGGNNYIELDEFTNGATNRMETEYVIVSATGTYSANGTLTSSTSGNQCFAAYKGATGAADKKLAALGVG